MASYLERFNTVLLRELHEVLRKEHGPQAVRITFIAAEAASNLAEAKIYYSVIGTAEDRAAAKKNLAKWNRSLRHGLASSGFFKNAPRLIFIQDDSIEKGSRVTTLLDSF